ncbi:hypothetical protein NQ317_015320 [Molorchus minor]|uniref:Uncharacterized protein n=1 Tax=Molorchus minor TaxID=1323400 RepID=A0ABQ9JBR8_9CUCU|nr:hypothetical protein NQ317_015320 [Molorchus minor]
MLFSLIGLYGWRSNSLRWTVMMLFSLIGLYGWRSNSLRWTVMMLFSLIGLYGWRSNSLRWTVMMLVSLIGIYDEQVAIRKIWDSKVVKLVWTYGYRALILRRNKVIENAWLTWSFQKGQCVHRRRFSVEDSFFVGPGFFVWIGTA